MLQGIDEPLGITRRSFVWRRAVVLPAILLMALLTLSDAWAENRAPDEKRPRIGLVLGGGGARGAAHVGVIKVLERLRVPVDYIVGTSMGAIVGGLYATGMSADELEHALARIDWDDMLTDRPPRAERPFRRKRDDDLYLVQQELGYGAGQVKFATGLLQGQKIGLLLESLTLPVAKVEDFDRLPTPFRAVATDIVNGKAVVLRRGDLARSIRASMSVPAFFAPVELDGKLLVDGAVSNNVPVDVVRTMGADVLIVVDVGTPPLTRKEANTLLGITSQLTWIMVARNTEAQLATLTARDILIRPELGDLGAGDFEASMTAVPFGQAAAEQSLAALRTLSVPEDEYRRYTEARATRRGGTPTVQFVRIDNQSQLSDEVLKARLEDQLGKPIDSRVLDRDIGEIYGLGNFESVRYEVVKENDKTGIVLHAREKAWGPNFLQFGLLISANADGDSTFNFGALFKRTALNRLNGEFRTGLQIGDEPALGFDLYQPLDYDARYFVSPALLYQRRNVGLFENDDRVAEYQVTRLGGELAAGRNFSNWGELRLGLERFTGDADVRTGGPTVKGFEFDSGGAFVQLATDRLDNVNFPRAGQAGRVRWFMSRPALGADEDFDQLEIGALYPKSWGHHTGMFSLAYASTVSGTAPIQDQFRLGGFGRLSGLDTNALSGQHRAFASAVYLRRISDIRLLPAYLGTSIEAGNVWQNRDDISLDNLIVSGSVFLGVDSFLGPLYLGLGHAEGGQTSAFLFLGRAFTERM